MRRSVVFLCGPAGSRARPRRARDHHRARRSAVQKGHVAAWVGVAGRTQWIQVGVSGFEGSPTSNLYYEISRAGRGPQYFEVEPDIAPVATRTVAVLEVRGHPNWWRVWVNGRPVFEAGAPGGEPQALARARDRRELEWRHARVQRVRVPLRPARRRCGTWRVVARVPREPPLPVAGLHGRGAPADELRRALALAQDSDRRALGASRFSSTAAAFETRMHPCETAWPSRSGRGVPWMPTTPPPGHSLSFE